MTQLTSPILSKLPPAEADKVSTIVRKKRETKNTVAIIGFAPTSRDAAPYNDPNVEVWGLNEAYAFEFMKSWDRWFQIHERWSFSRKNNRNDPHHWEWLQQEHDFPIYMLDKYHDVPASVKYPFDEVVETLLSGVLRGDPYENEEIVNLYFTSSFAWMCALACYEKKAGIHNWERIEVYGFEMATDTEYKHQKGSTEFWLGLAAGLGIEVKITKHCLLLKGELYGKQIDSLIPRHVLETRKKQLTNRKEIIIDSMEEITQRRLELEREGKLAFNESEKLKGAKREAQEEQTQILAKEYQNIKNEELASVSRINAYIGAEQEIDALINYIDCQLPELGAEYSEELQGSFAHRQELDFRRSQLHKATEEVMSALNAVSGSRQTVEQKGAQLFHASRDKKLKISRRERRCMKKMLEELNKMREHLIAQEHDTLARANAVRGGMQIVNEFMSMIDTTLPVPDPEDELGRALDIVGRIQVESDDGEEKETKEEI